MVYNEFCNITCAIHRKNSLLCTYIGSAIGIGFLMNIGYWKTEKLISIHLYYMYVHITIKYVKEYYDATLTSFLIEPVNVNGSIITFYWDLHLRTYIVYVIVTSGAGWLINTIRRPS